MAFLSGVPWRLVGIVALVLAVTALWYRGSHYEERAARFEKLLDSAIEVSNANAEAAKAYAEEAQRLNEVAAKAVQVRNDIRRSSEQRQREIDATLPENDGPLAPVLRDQLDRLPVATRPEGNRSPTRASNPGVFADADTGAVSAAFERNAEGRRARN